MEEMEAQEVAPTAGPAGQGDAPGLHHPTATPGVASRALLTGPAADFATAVANVVLAWDGSVPEAGLRDALVTKLTLTQRLVWNNAHSRQLLGAGGQGWAEVVEVAERERPEAGRHVFAMKTCLLGRDDVEGQAAAVTEAAVPLLTQLSTDPRRTALAHHAVPLVALEVEAVADLAQVLVPAQRLAKAGPGYAIRSLYACMSGDMGACRDRELWSDVEAGGRSITLLSMERGLDAALQMACAVAALHQAGLVHGDLKPANFLYTRSAPPSGAAPGPGALRVDSSMLWPV